MFHEVAEFVLFHCRPIQHGQFVRQPEQTDVQHVHRGGHVSVIVSYLQVCLQLGYIAQKSYLYTGVT